MALKPVGGQDRGADLPEDPIPDEQVPPGQERTWVGPHIRPDQPAQHLYRIRLQVDPVLEGTACWLRGLVDAISGGVVLPPVVDADQPVFVRVTRRQIYPTVRTPLSDEPVTA